MLLNLKLFFKVVKSIFVISTSAISKNRLSRGENLVVVLTQKSKNRLQNFVEKRRNCSSGAIFSPFPQYFQYIFLTKGVKLHSHLCNLVVRIVFSSILQIWYVEVRISRSVWEGPFDFEITRVDCIYKCNMAINHNTMEAGWYVANW